MRSSAFCVILFFLLGACDANPVSSFPLSNDPEIREIEQEVIDQVTAEGLDVYWQQYREENFPDNTSIWVFQRLEAITNAVGVPRTRSISFASVLENGRLSSRYNPNLRAYVDDSDTQNYYFLYHFYELILSKYVAERFGDESGPGLFTEDAFEMYMWDEVFRRVISRLEASNFSSPELEQYVATFNVTRDHKKEDVENTQNQSFVVMADSAVTLLLLQQETAGWARGAPSSDGTNFFRQASDRFTEIERIMSNLNSVGRVQDYARQYPEQLHQEALEYYLDAVGSRGMDHLVDLDRMAGNLLRERFATCDAARRRLEQMTPESIRDIVAQENSVDQLCDQRMLKYTSALRTVVYQNPP